jgi:hypothetical protein
LLASLCIEQYTKHVSFIKSFDYSLMLVQNDPIKRRTLYHETGICELKAGRHPPVESSRMPLIFHLTKRSIILKNNFTVFMSNLDAAFKWRYANLDYIQHLFYPSSHILSLRLNLVLLSQNPWHPFKLKNRHNSLSFRNCCANVQSIKKVAFRHSEQLWSPAKSITRRR